MPFTLVPLEHSFDVGFIESDNVFLWNRGFIGIIAFGRCILDMHRTRSPWGREVTSTPGTTALDRCIGGMGPWRRVERDNHVFGSEGSVDVV